MYLFLHILLQLLFWEKVVIIDDPNYIPHVSIKPLMKNWSEEEAERRCQYDYKNGRSLVPGKVMVLILIHKCCVMILYIDCVSIFFT